MAHADLTKRSPTMVLNFRTIFIVSYGRSGSTLLQGILNSIEGVLIKGENQNIFEHFYRAYQTLLEIQEKHPNASRPANPWYGSCWFDPNQFKQDLHMLGKNFLLHTGNTSDEEINAYGFKEIRYATMNDPIQFIDFLVDIFPSSCIIHLTRDHNHVAASQRRKFKIQQFEPDVIHRKLYEFDQAMRNYGRVNSHYFSIDYSDLIGTDFSGLKNLYKFLGAPYCESTLIDLIAKPHSY
jgi:hypothetical protein